MKRTSTKAVSAVAGMALTLTLMVGGARAQNPRQQAAMLARSPQKASEVYKNLRLLQDIPADQVHTTMRFIAGALGVGCNYCHEGSGAVFAHHGAAEFESGDRLTTVEATATRLDLINPHGRLYFGVKDENGNVQEWHAELSAIKGN